MTKTIVAHALAAIDGNGKWIIYGFKDMATVAHLHETGVTEDLAEPMAFYRIKVPLEIPDNIGLQDVEPGTIEKLST